MAQIMFNKKAFINFLKDNKLIFESTSIMLLLQNSMDSDNCVRLTEKDISNALEIPLFKVSKAIKQFKKRNILTIENEVRFKFNSNFCYHSSLDVTPPNIEFPYPKKYLKKKKKEKRKNKTLNALSNAE